MDRLAPPMVRQIEDLLNDSEPTLESVEDTLTEGYARALALEAELLRLERRLGEVARDADANHADEVRHLGTRLTRADGELERLRSLLDTLRDRARALRAAS
jgi:chromosome segregation ATPase